MDNKDQIRQMLDNIIDGNEEQAKVDFHKYMVNKVQSDVPLQNKQKQVNEAEEGRLIDLKDNPSPEEVQTAWPERLGYGGKKIDEKETIGWVSRWVEKNWPNASHYGISFFGYSPNKDKFFVVYDTDEDVDKRDDEQLPSSVLSFSRKYGPNPVGASFNRKMPLGRADKAIDALKKEVPDLIEIVSY